MASSASQLFTPFRAVGFVTDDTPCAVRGHGGKNFVTTVVGKTFLTYECDKLHVSFFGPTLAKRIHAITTRGEIVLTASGVTVQAWKRAQLLHTFQGHTRPPCCLLCFGNTLLSASDQEIIVWNLDTRELHTRFEFEDTFHVTSLMHPPTYLNKVLVGSREGSLRILNTRTSKNVYSFVGWGTEVRCMAQAPVVDVVGIGLQDGRIMVHNIKYDQTIVSFRQEQGPVTTLSFRTDGTPQLVSGTEAGQIVVWDLEKKKLHSILSDAHDEAVCSLYFLVNEPVLVSSGADNALKMWIFDQGDGMARLLRARCGHSRPPHYIRFYGTSGHHILSAAGDRSLRLFSTIQEQRNRELSQGSIQKKAKKWNLRAEDLKLPPIVAFDASEVKERDFANVVSCHIDEKATYVWHSLLFKRGEHILHAPDLGSGTVKSVCLSACGNFTFLGTSKGSIEKFNMQSGLHRGSFRGGHSSAVYGVACDALNRTLFTGGYDGVVCFWNFRSGELEDSVDVGSPVSQLILHRESSLLAVGCDDFVIRIYDADTHRLVRHFTGHRNQIMDLAFSPDARWLVSVSMDMTIRTWDVPSGRVIDWFRVEKPATSVSFSPTGEFLATTHTDSLGIHLWSNRARFSGVILHSVSEDPGLSALPGLSAEGEEEEGREVFAGDGVLADDITASTTRATPLGPGLLTLSSASRSRWKTICHLDMIKERNKPKEPPKEPEAAPFFLPTLPGVEPVFVAPKPTPEDGVDPPSRFINLGHLQPKSGLAHLLASSKNCPPVLEYLGGLSPSAIEVEFRSLGEDDLPSLLEFLANALASRSNFEIVQAYVSLFLKIHGETVSQLPHLLPHTQRLQMEQHRARERLELLLEGDLCMVQHLARIHP